MALATRCPNCHALFRVVADQLKLRAGLVRCGACGHAFDAIGTLSYLDDASLRPVTTLPATLAPDGNSPLTLRIAPSGSQADHPGDDPVGKLESQAPAGAIACATDEDARAVPDPAGALDAAASRDAPSTAGADGPVQIAPAAPTAGTGQELNEGAAYAQRRGAPEPGAQVMPDAPDGSAIQEQVAEAIDAGSPEPGVDAAAFLQERPEPRRKGLAIAMAVGALLLSVALLAQIVLIYRAEIVAQWPATRPALTQVCRAMNCTVGWPMRGEMLAVVGSELQSLPGTSAFELTAVVRNRASITLALPAIEVTLTDTQNHALARKVFAPADYLAAGEAAARLGDGIEAGADMTVRIVFEARGLSAAGFVVYPFYL